MHLYLPDLLHRKDIWSALTAKRFEQHSLNAINHIVCRIVNSLVLWQSFVVSGFGINENLDLTRGNQQFALTVASANVAIQILVLTSSQFAQVRCTHVVKNAYTPESHYIH